MTQHNLEALDRISGHPHGAWEAVCACYEPDAEKSTGFRSSPSATPLEAVREWLDHALSAAVEEVMADVVVSVIHGLSAEYENQTNPDSPEWDPTTVGSDDFVGFLEREAAKLNPRRVDRIARALEALAPPYPGQEVTSELNRRGAFERSLRAARILRGDES